MNRGSRYEPSAGKLCAGTRHLQRGADVTASHGTQKHLVDTPYRDHLIVTCTAHWAKA